MDVKQKMPPRKEIKRGTSVVLSIAASSTAVALTMFPLKTQFAKVTAPLTFLTSKPPAYARGCSRTPNPPPLEITLTELAAKIQLSRVVCSEEL